MKPDVIPVFKPLVEKEEIQAASDALGLGWLGMGSCVGKFENKLKEFLETSDRFVAAVSTGHGALHLAMLLAGVGPGDEVITPAFNNVADFQAILAAGGRPVFCDVRGDTLCIDLDKAESLIGPETKALIAMDYTGCLCDHHRVAELASKYGLRVIHDAAHSFGSRFEGKKIGSFSDIVMFSFDPVKTLTCIDGGLLVVRDQESLERVRQMRFLGTQQKMETLYTDQRSWTYDVSSIGFRYHLANLHAAIGLAQLEKIDLISANRYRYALFFQKQFSALSEVQGPLSDFKDIVPCMYYLRVPAQQRKELRDHMAKKGVETGIHWQPGNAFSLFQDCKRGDLAVTNRIAGEILSLPFHSKMTDETLERVVDSVSSFFG